MRCFEVRFILHLFPILLLAAILTTGCSSNGSNLDPVAPDNPNSSGQDNLPVTENRSGSSSRYLLSYNEIAIDAENMEAEIIPVRDTSIHFNILKLLEVAPCTNCLKIKSISGTPNNTILVGLEIQHPFIDPVFTVFDVRGIIMTSGSRLFPASGWLTSDMFLGNSELVNADGHTTLYNVTTFGKSGGFQEYYHGKWATQMYPDTTLNGFMRHATSGASNVRNALYAGTAVTREYEIYKPSSYFVLGYAIDASWFTPTVNPVSDPQTDFPPEANCSEPWKITVNQDPIGTGLVSTGGQTVLTMDIYDYQGKLTHYVPSLECPELWDGLKYASFKANGDGFTSFEITVSNENQAPNYFYLCLISVTDIDDDTSPEWMDLTAYKIVRLPVGYAIPPNVEVFNASDGDPALYDRKVELTWEPLVSELVEWYDIDRLDLDPVSGSWTWSLVKSAAQPTAEWTDNNPRYCGPEDPIHYRIRSRNDAGPSLDYKEDTGYPKPRDVGMALWCVADNASGSNAVYSWSTAMLDYADCNSFWNRYGLNFVLENPDGFLWAANPAYNQINGEEALQMHDNFGKAQTPDSINVYYVGSVNGNTHMAYCNSYCPGYYHNTENVFIVISSEARGAGVEEMPIVLAHECGHAAAHYFDVYLLDTNNNLIIDDGTSCASVNTWCSVAPETPVLFCDINACYSQEPDAWHHNPWNLMWYSAQNKQVSQYNLIDTQAVYMHEWIHGNKNNYPFP